MMKTPHRLIDHVIRIVCGRPIDQLVPVTSGGQHETYSAELHRGSPVIVRIARRGEPWFTDEARLMARARDAGVPTPDVLGVEHVEHDGELLSCSVLSVVPGRALVEIADTLPAADLERLVVEAGELLARLHGVAPDGGMQHTLEVPDTARVARATGVVLATQGSDAAALVEQASERLHELASRPPPEMCLAHGDWLPKHLITDDDDGEITGVIDWEFAGAAAAARDLGRWEVSARAGLWARADWLRRGYARVSPIDGDADAWIAAHAMAWALEVLAWQRPSTQAHQRRCVEVIARYVSR